MRQILTVPALLVLVATAAPGQASWDAELGIQGGIARIKPAGTGGNDQTDVWDLPGLASGYGALFAVVPVTRRLAVEPALVLIQTSVGEPTALFASATSVTLGLRGNVGLASRFYAATGGVLNYSESSGTHDFQLGIQAALGYRITLGRRLRGRLEAHAITFRKTDNLEPLNVYALLFGLSARLK